MSVPVHRRRVRDNEEVNNALLSSCYLIKWVERDWLRGLGLSQQELYYLCCAKDVMRVNGPFTFRMVSEAIKAGTQSFYNSSWAMGKELLKLGYLEVSTPSKFRRGNGSCQRIAGRYVLTGKAQYLFRTYCEIMRREINKLYEDAGK